MNHIQAYIDYVNITGDLGDNLMTEEQFIEFQRKQIENAHLRVYVAYVNSQGATCKEIGPSSLCFCSHRFRDHNKDLDEDTGRKRANCRDCRCRRFKYLPSAGTWRVRCMCKHSATDHDVKPPHKCRLCNCDGFHSSYTCTCGEPYANHRTIFETRDERIANGRPVDNRVPNAMQLNMGGIVNFSSLVDDTTKAEARMIAQTNIDNMQVAQVEEIDDPNATIVQNAVSNLKQNLKPRRRRPNRLAERRNKRPGNDTIRRKKDTNARREAFDQLQKQYQRFQLDQTPRFKEEDEDIDQYYR
ncbi:hypothetical protein PCE1_000743 [Barthelona sp. PCE]